MSFFWDEPVGLQGSPSDRAEDHPTSTDHNAIAEAIVRATRPYQPGGRLHEQNHNNHRGPITIAVYGPWGSGKTSILRQIEGIYSRSNTTGRTYISTEAEAFTLRFEPWRYEGEDNLILPLLAELSAQIASSIQKESVKKAAAETGMRLLGRAARAAGRTAVNTLAKKIGLDGEDITRIGEDFASYYEERADRYSYPQSEQQAFMSDLRDLLLLASRGHMETLQNTDSEPFRRPVVILIDDLDRCSPSQVRRMLESMKNFLWIEDVTYILALDEAQVTAALTDQRFGRQHMAGDQDYIAARTWARRYLEKFFLYCFDLNDAELEMRGIPQTVRDTTWDELLRSVQDVPRLEQLAEIMTREDPAGVHSAPNSEFAVMRRNFNLAPANARKIKRIARWLYYQLNLAPQSVCQSPADNAGLAWIGDLHSRFGDYLFSEAYPEDWQELFHNRSMTGKHQIYITISDLLISFYPDIATSLSAPDAIELLEIETDAVSSFRALVGHLMSEGRNGMYDVTDFEDMPLLSELARSALARRILALHDTWDTREIIRLYQLANYATE